MMPMVILLSQGGARVYINGDGHDMSLESGYAADGTYSYTSKLPEGMHMYSFAFINEYDFVMTPTYSGPLVGPPGCCIEIRVEVANGPVTNNIEICFGYGPDLGNLETTCWPATEMPQDLWIANGRQLMFTVNLESNNHTFIKWEFRDDDGNLVGESTASGYGFILLSGNIHATAYLSYTPINYTISGSVLQIDSTPVLGGVDLVVSSSVQTLMQHTDNGNFSFNNVKGGVSVSVTPSASAGGYEFSPPTLSYDNLKTNHTGESITAYSSDFSVPMTSFLTVPPAVSENSSASFSWIGEDDVTAPENLLYQFKTDGLDPDWSSWASDTSKSYDLKNGVYTFEVTAKDEAENINQSPTNYTFVINAAPKVVSSIQTKRSVWASRVTLEMPASPNHPNNVFILLPEHSGSSDSELVPVTIHAADESTPLGASDIVSEQMGVTPRISKADIGWRVTLPEAIPNGGSAQYDIVWGKINYFGWHKNETVPRDFPNFSPGGDYFGFIEGYFLDEGLRLWRWASKYRNRISTFGDEITWALMNVSDIHGPVINERVLRFLPGIPWDGSLGRIYECRLGKVFDVGKNVCQAWIEEKYEKVWLGDDYDFFSYHRYILQLFDETGATVNFFESSFQEDTWIECPKRIIHDRLFVTGRTYNNVASTRDLWFIIHNTTGCEVIPRTVFESIPRTSGDLDPEYVKGIGVNVAFLFYHDWDTLENDYRQNVRYQVRDLNGTLVKPSTTLNLPLLPDSVEQDDEYSITSAVTDNEGKVWVSMERNSYPQPTEYYYSIIGTNSNVWKGPIQTPSLRRFYYCDKDGYIWATEGPQFLALNPDDTVAVGPKTPAWIPNQNVAGVVASVGPSGYRLYDRWSPQIISIDVPSGIRPGSMELYDLNLWDNELHAVDVNIVIDGESIWYHSGPFTGHASVDVADVLDEGINILTMTQKDFLGGQVLVTFPYIICVEGDINCDGKVNEEDLRILADQWLEPPGTPSADLWPSTLDNFVNFFDFAVMAKNWNYEKFEKLYDFALDTDPGWSTEGQWAFGQPTGGGGTELGNPDPASGYSGLNVYGVNLGGDYSVVVGGPYHLTAGPFDCSGYHNIQFKFARWLNTDESSYVSNKIEVSNNGSDRSVVWGHTSSITDDSWEPMECNISDTADRQPTVYIRWSYQILDSHAFQCSGWNIDDVELWGNPG
jgi:hypothetical protein